MYTIGVLKSMKSSCKHASDLIFLNAFLHSIKQNENGAPFISLPCSQLEKQVKLVESSPEVTTPDNWINNWKGKNILCR